MTVCTPQRHYQVIQCYFTCTFCYRGEEGEVTSKKEFIQTARLIAKESEEVVKMARKVADACTDKRMKRVS